MTCTHPHDVRTTQCRACVLAKLNRREEYAQRRAAVLEALRPGKWVHGEKLWRLAYPGMARVNLRSLIYRMRREGYEIEAEQAGPSSRGYRLISEPQQAQAA